MLSAPLPPPPPPQSTCDQPVVMVVTGVTHERERMLAYARAIADSELYQKLGDRSDGKSIDGFTP